MAPQLFELHVDDDAAADDLSSSRRTVAESAQRRSDQIFRQAIDRGMHVERNRNTSAVGFLYVWHLDGRSYILRLVG
ncbi:hypothetical protein RGCCGE502_17455 [Rhizobium grahamii CCGE 502]|uniref:Uncharacterized protein n=1 Tax=Rhizobium grahamii CCGE 502 TaxID=990285 RepID=S3HFY7_9HYPH|nr:hypothetical protein RGCCGE502_17455 [Rhizobium grahamii CCGE 502]